MCAVKKEKIHDKSTRRYFIGRYPSSGHLNGHGLGVGSLLLAEANNHVDEATVVCHPLLGTSCLLLLLLCFLDFGGLTLHFTSTSKTSVDLSCTFQLTPSTHHTHRTPCTSVYIFSSAGVTQNIPMFLSLV